MLWLALGGFTLFLLLGGLRAFERASIPTIKAFLAWAAALGAITLTLLLVLTGREGVALGALILAAPLLWDRFRASQWGRWADFATRAAGTPPPSAGPMTREEAYQVLGLQPGASQAEIRAAYHRLMRAAHPDSGGSDWLAARVNQARDVLLSRGWRRWS
jgi:DnaJ homolog subfamily C member 19